MREQVAAVTQDLLHDGMIEVLEDPDTEKREIWVTPKGAIAAVALLVALRDFANTVVQDRERTPDLSWFGDIVGRAHAWMLSRLFHASARAAMTVFHAEEEVDASA